MEPTPILDSLVKAIQDAVTSNQRHDDVALPLFNPEKNDNGAEAWCRSIEKLGAELKWSSIQQAAKAARTSVTQYLYCSGWESGLATMARVLARLLLIATRASKPLVLTAGEITELSLISYANSFQDSGGPLKDLSIRVSKVQTLANELKNHPEFTLEGFRQTGYYQVGDVGKYLSTNLRNYLFYGNVNPRDEGVILTLHYSKRPAREGSITKQKDGTLSYYVHKTEDLTSDERKNIYRYLDTIKGQMRDKRAVPDSAN